MVHLCFDSQGKKLNREATGKHFKASLRSFAKYQNCFKWRPTKIQVNTAPVNWAVTGRLRLNFTFGATQRIERVFQPRAKEGLEASFASGDEKMQMVRLKRGFYGVGRLEWARRKNGCEILYTCTNGFNEMSPFQLISGGGAKGEGGGAWNGRGEREINCQKEGFKTKDHLRSAARPRRSIWS